MLHTSYKMGILMSNKRVTIEQRIAMENRKKEIQNDLCQKLGLKVDKVM
jgi:hypothetical protein